MNYFQCYVTVSYETEKGLKKKRESYLIQAETQTEASVLFEQKMKERLSMGQEFEITAVNYSRILEVLN